MRKVIFATNEYYHIYNRGVEKRDVFLCDSDYFRFLYCLEGFNDLNPTCYKNILNSKIDILNQKNRVKLVNIISYCLMPNHFHIIVQQKEDKGISKFMHKVSTAYSMFFNLKYSRSGILFQGVFKAKHIDTESYLIHLSRYIHLNPIDLAEQENDRQDPGGLENYKWSSFQFYLNQKRPSIIELKKDTVSGYFKNSQDLRAFTYNNASPEPEEFQILKID